MNLKSGRPCGRRWRLPDGHSTIPIKLTCALAWPNSGLLASLRHDRHDEREGQSCQGRSETPIGPGAAVLMRCAGSSQGERGLLSEHEPRRSVWPVVREVGSKVTGQCTPPPDSSEQFGSQNQGWLPCAPPPRRFLRHAPGLRELRGQGSTTPSLGHLSASFHLRRCRLLVGTESAQGLAAFVWSFGSGQASGTDAGRSNPSRSADESGCSPGGCSWRSRQPTPSSAPRTITTPIAISKVIIANTTPADPYFL